MPLPTSSAAPVQPEALTFDEAQRRLLANAPLPSSTERVPSCKCAGSVLAERVDATLDLPRADSSAMDGYALRHGDILEHKTLPVQDRCYAGDIPQPLRPGHAIRLFTGATMPAHADTVIMQEYVRESAGAIEILRVPRQGQHVRKQGEDVHAGQLLLPRGTLLRPAQIALMSSQGIDRVAVFTKLRVGILTTGDELVAPGSVGTQQQTFDSNGPMLAALVEGMGASVPCVLHARDNPVQIRSAIAQLLPQCDVIISAGGASVGERDLMQATLQSLGATISVWQVRMKPGKPLSIATIFDKPFVCLPGNPAAAFAVFMLLLTPMIRRMQGRMAILPPAPKIGFDAPRKGHEYRDEFLRVLNVVDDEGRMRLVPFEQQSPAALSSLAQASGFARVRPGCSLSPGDLAQYYDFQHWLA
ncbi:MAG: molybdopterin molybdotransferase [Paraburkholderia sp.]|nr:molybdopterin molybdotransferase [Paraburkholderia sp.]